MKLRARPGALLCSQPVRIVRDTDSERTRPVDGLLEEISPSHATISLACPVRRGSELKISCRECELRGTVVGCQTWVNGYLAEVEFLEGAAWSPARFNPERLFNPLSLMCDREGCRPDCVRAGCVAPTAEPVDRAAGHRGRARTIQD